MIERMGFLRHHGLQAGVGVVGIGSFEAETDSAGYHLSPGWPACIDEEQRMNTYQAETYGQRIAGVYDDWYTAYDDAAVTALQELAHGGRALELGIGTGRIALPLQRLGVEVHGVDASEAMVARLRAKPGGSTLPVSMGNFADVPVEGEYSLIYVLFNTFYALLTQEEQVRCFGNVASHLSPDGVFVIEAFVPDLSRFQRGQAIQATQVGVDAVHLDVSRHDPVGQLVSAQHVVLSDQGIRLYPVKLRYVWPAELDLMAQLAGLRLKHRWSSWNRAGFSAESGKHISVFGHAAA
jgi:SAM-dependent methyltransferase